MDITQLTSSVRSTLSAVAGGLGGLFDGDGPIHQASLVIDRDAELPGGTELFTPGRSNDALIRMARSGDAGDSRTVCIKIVDAYGPGRDQDFLLASSADGIPFHHAVLPAERADSRLYSSLWLYLAGFEPVAFGLRAAAVTDAAGLTDGDRFDFLVSSAVGRFRTIGALVVGDEAPPAATRFAARNAGGGLRALPPALFYRG